MALAGLIIGSVVVGSSNSYGKGYQKSLAVSSPTNFIKVHVVLKYHAVQRHWFPYDTGITSLCFNIFTVSSKSFSYHYLALMSAEFV
jgi:hypothetical protein